MIWVFRPKSALSCPKKYSALPARCALSLDHGLLTTLPCNARVFCLLSVQCVLSLTSLAKSVSALLVYYATLRRRHSDCGSMEQRSTPADCGSVEQRQANESHAGGSFGVCGSTCCVGSDCNNRVR